MKKLFEIDKLHRRRLSTRESALKDARAAQTQFETVLLEQQRAEVQAREHGLQVKRDVDAVLFASAVKRPEIGRAQHQLIAAKEAVVAAREAVVAAEIDVAAATLRTQEAVRAWRMQAAQVEKFDIIVQLKREERNVELLYREELELEDIPRRRT
jgi:hypothetical protein